MKKEPLFKVNPANPNQRHNFIITDFVANYEDSADDLPTPHPAETRGCCRSLCAYLRLVNPSYWAFLALLGLLTAFLSFFIDYSSQELRRGKPASQPASSPPPPPPRSPSLSAVTNLCFAQSESRWWLGYLLWVVFGIGFAMLAAAAGEFISRDAEGSGIPEVKSILAGLNIYKYLSFQTLIGKVIGLYFALVAGLSIGKEGPFVHLATGVANKLSKLSLFAKIERNQAVKKQMLAAAVAAGVASTFGAPMGGVLFSIEVTSTYYMVSNLWKAFYCATWSVVAFKLVQGLQRAELFTRTDIQNIAFGWHMFGYVVLGTLCGLLGALFITVVGKIIYLRKRLAVPFVSNRWGYVAFVALVTALCAFPIGFLQSSDRDNLQQLFSPQSLTQLDNAKWSDPAEGFNLFTFAFLKFVLTVLAVTCPIPAGVFTPIFTLGASFGRLFGFSAWFLFSRDFSHDYVAMYAIIGAAGVASSVTHTISVCVIVFELTGQVTFLMPLLVCVLLSYAVGSSLSVSYFDLLLDMKGLPYMPALKSREAYRLTAADIMNRNFLYLTRSATLSDIAVLLQYVGAQPKAVPVVESAEQKLLLFSVQAQSLRKYLIAQFNQLAPRLTLETRAQLSKHFHRLNALASTDPAALHSSFPPPGPPSEFEIEQADHLPNFGGVELEERVVASSEIVSDFWRRQIDFLEVGAELDRAPFSVFEHTSLAKVHFLFTMLNLSQLIVLNRGLAVGIIAKAEFLKNQNQDPLL